MGTSSTRFGSLTLMINLTPLATAVSQETSSGRLGEPVFARLILVISSDHGHLIPLSEEAVVLIQEMLQFQVEAVLARGSQESGSLTVQLDLERGRSALVVVAIRREEEPQLDLLLVGNHGTLRYRNDGPLLEAELEAGSGGKVAESTGAASDIRRALQQSLGSGKPVRL